MRHFLREDPACVEEANKGGGEAWVVARDGLGRGCLAGPTGHVEAVKFKRAISTVARSEARLGVKRRLAATRCRSGAWALRGNTALHLAAIKGFGAVAELLLQHKADLEVKNENGPGARVEGRVGMDFLETKLSQFCRDGKKFGISAKKLFISSRRFARFDSGLNMLSLFYGTVSRCVSVAL